MSGYLNGVGQVGPQMYPPMTGGRLSYGGGYQPMSPYAGTIGGYSPLTVPLSFGAPGTDAPEPITLSTSSPRMDPSYIVGKTSSQNISPIQQEKLDNLDGGLFGAGALDKFKTLSSIIGTFGNIYSGIQMNKIAKQQLAFAKESYATNLKNQLQTYNTSLDARSTSAHMQRGQSQAEADAYTAKHRLEK